MKDRKHIDKIKYVLFEKYIILLFYISTDIIFYIL